MSHYDYDVHVVVEDQDSNIGDYADDYGISDLAMSSAAHGM